MIEFYNAVDSQGNIHNSHEHNAQIDQTGVIVLGRVDQHAPKPRGSIVL